MLLYLYHFTWTLFVLLSLPLLVTKKGRRLRDRIVAKVPPDPPAGGTLWVHALSVGEVISALPLLEALGRRFPQKKIIFTVTTTQGTEVARETVKGAVGHILPMPIDFWWSVNRIIHFIKPSLFVLVETDLWPGLIFSLKKKGIKTVLVNGRISPRTHRSYKRLRPLARPLLNAIEVCMVQTEVDQSRLLDVGVKPEKIRTVGNLKFDQDRPPMEEKELSSWRDLLGLNDGEVLWVAGSTHPGEEAVIFQVLKRLRADFPELRLIIAPRRIERSDEIRRLSTDSGFRTFLRTDMPKPGELYDVLVLNTLGELGRIYGIGKVSFVGGSLVPIGGHNLLEPASFGHPVLFGQHTHNFELMSRLLIQAGGGLRVQNSDALYSALKDLLIDSEKSEIMGRKARSFVEAHQGALQRILDAIGDCLSTETPTKQPDHRGKSGEQEDTE